MGLDKLQVYYLGQVESSVD